MQNASGFSSRMSEHYSLGVAIGRLRFFGIWFSSRSIGNYPMIGLPYNPIGGNPYTCPSIKDLTLNFLPKSPRDRFVAEVREEMGTFFSRFGDSENASAERAAAMLAFGDNLAERYQRYLNKLRGPYEETIALAEKIDSVAASDLRDAVDCRIAGLFKPCVAMVRRSIEGALLTVGATGDRLIEVIEDAVKKKVITRSEGNLAHAMRWVANRGAHPNDEIPEDIGEADADSTLDLAKRIFISLGKVHTSVSPA